MKFQRILQAVNFQPWLITTRAHNSIRALVESKLAGEVISVKTRGEIVIDMLEMGDEIPVMQKVDRIAVIPVAGVMGKGLGNMEKSCGAVDVGDIEKNILAAVNDCDVDGIMLKINSPGGTVGGLPELADAVTAARQAKPVMAYTDDEMCSAAYWLASGSTAIYGSKSCEVGSIGVYMPWVDKTAAYEAWGMKVELIKNTGGTFKGAGYPGTALTDEQRDQLQAQVDGIFAMFAGHITQNRTVGTDAMRGQTFMGAEAKAAGLIDSICSFDQAMADLKMMSKRA